MKRKPNFFRLYFIVSCIITFIMLSLVQIVNEFKYYDFMILLSFIFIGILALYNIFTSFRHKYSLYKLHGYFFLIFMFLAPVYQYATNEFSWGLVINDRMILITNLILIVWLFIYLVMYRYTKEEINEGSYLPISRKYIIFSFFMVILASLIILIYVGGFNNLFFRNIEGNLEASLNSIITRSIRPIPVLFVAYIVLMIKYKEEVTPLIKVMFITSLILAIATNFPTGISRYHTAAVYIGLIVLFFKKVNFDLLFLVGIIFVFPILDMFRNTTNNLKEALSWQTIDFATGHFDAYSMLLRTVDYVSIEGITFGKQLVGVLLFFIPRKLWPNKPVGSGSFVGEELGLSFLNISSPLPAEAIINFGFIFFIIFVILLGFFTKKIDTMYWKISKGIRYIDVYYIFLLGFFFFILRGDLLSTYAFTIAFFFPLILTFLLSKIKLK